MAITIIARHMDPQTILQALGQIAPQLDVRIWPDDGDTDEISYALCWKPPQGIFQQYANLKAIGSLGAGIDFLLKDPQLPAHLPVTRIVSQQLAQSMFDYVASCALNYCRQFDLYRKLQQDNLWRPLPPLLCSEVTIGIMGLGELGRFVASKLLQLGFKVVGWSRSSKDISGVECYAADAQLSPFLAKTQMLFCLLPLTDATEGILNRELFIQLPQGAYVVNVARGEHLIEQDLLWALKSGHLRGATLDVFRQEPLPDEHPFWQCDQITITPHCASATYPQAAAPQIVENYLRLCQNQPLLYQVNLKNGY